MRRSRQRNSKIKFQPPCREVRGNLLEKGFPWGSCRRRRLMRAILPYCPMYGQLRQPCHTIPYTGNHAARSSSVCGRGRRHLPPRGKAFSQQRLTPCIIHSSNLFFRASGRRRWIFCCISTFTAAAAAACGTVAGFVLRPAAGADGAAGLHQPRPAGPWHRLCRASGDLYCIGTGIGLVLRRIGGTPLTVWHIFWLGGITPWLLTAGIMWWGRRRRCGSVRQNTALQRGKICRTAG